MTKACRVAEQKLEETNNVQYIILFRTWYKNIWMFLPNYFPPVVAIISFPFLRLGTNGFFSIFCEAIFARSVRPSLEKFLAVEK